ncbi:hypothetical protein ACHAP5_010256 [Fusarium lateritium]
MHSNVQRLLQQLEISINESIEVVSDVRLPLDEMSIPSDISDESSDESSRNDDFEQKELAMRLSSMEDILKNLYQLSYKIRDPSLRPISTKVTVMRHTDKDTGIDLFDRFLDYDRSHLQELLEALRSGRTPPNGSDDFLLERLLVSNGMRRKNFRYWSEHARKINIQTKPTEMRVDKGKSVLKKKVAAEKEVEQSKKNLPLDNGTSTLISQTNATLYDPIRDDQTEKETVISFASTAIDVEGRGIEIPKAPAEALEGKPFICPYCEVLCPPTQGRGKAWRSHVLHDLQPYIAKKGKGFTNPGTHGWNMKQLLIDAVGVVVITLK